ncbi:MAG: serine hydrolase, partial [Saprospiraceae bacterium]
MKRNAPFFLLLVAVIFSTTTFLTAQSAATLTKITQVENGLSNYHQIKGEPTWTIAERMEHYGVPGMSIAVIHDYKVVWTKTYGVVNKETKIPVNENTLFQ